MKKRYRTLCLLLAMVLLGGCALRAPAEAQPFYEHTFLELFDTVSKIVGYAETEQAFRETARQLQAQLEQYHKLFDIYEEYPGLNNLKTVNDRAGREPVTVDRELIEFLLYCKETARRTDGAVNAAMGSVLALWHEARSFSLENPDRAYLPEQLALEEAAAHTDPEDIIIDEQASTVFFADPLLKLDVGAVAKGYAVEQVSRQAPEGWLISVGGNIRATGEKPDGSEWKVGLQDPSGSGMTHVVRCSRAAVVTSGDYQRCYTVDGISYHHIIDPDTRMPGTKWRAVSVVCGDSAAADVLSTALFLLDQPSGQALLDAFDAEAVWTLPDGTECFSPGFSEFLAG